MKSRTPLKPRLIVWCCGTLLALAIASYLAARIFALNETVRILSEDDNLQWEGGSAAVSERVQHWQAASLWAIGISLALYLGAAIWYLTRGRRGSPE